jgi:ABC-type amino acid transport substrate-binding protein
MTDIHNQKLAKYDDNKRHIFTAKFVRTDKHAGIFQQLTVNNEDNVVVDQIALRMSKTFQNLKLVKGDVVQFEGVVKHTNLDDYTVQRPTDVEKIASAPAQTDSKINVIGDDWDWFKN